LSIAAFVISMALLWRDNVEGEDTTTLMSWASAIFLCATVIGPGLLAKSLFSMLVPAEAHAKNRRRLLREIKRAETVRKAAADEIRQIQNWHSWYVQEANRMRSIYTLAYHEASGKNTPHDGPEGKTRIKTENTNPAARDENARRNVENPYQS
jgi:hypothetical protein